MSGGLTTIHEAEAETRTAARMTDNQKRGEKAKAWVVQGKVQGSIVFRQYYPEGGWGCVILLTGLLMTLLTTGFQMSFSVLVKPAVWKFQPSLLSFLSLTGLSSSVSMVLSPLTVSFCKVRFQQFEFKTRHGGQKMQQRIFIPRSVMISFFLRKSPSA